MYDSEIKVMEIIWENDPNGISAKEISLIAEEKIGWNKNTTYTVVKKLVEKGYIKRSEPNFICTALVKKDEIQKDETNMLIKRLFNGSKRALVSSLLENEAFTKEELDELRELINKR